jgi:hypothetical protein
MVKKQAKSAINYQFPLVLRVLYSIALASTKAAANMAKKFFTATKGFKLKVGA